jgi:hypothetical protein
MLINIIIIIINARYIQYTFTITIQDKTAKSVITEGKHVYQEYNVRYHYAATPM